MSNRGFTLIELIVGLSVAAIVLSIAIPSFKSIIDSSQSRGLTHDFVTAINVTRNEAVTRGERVTMCKSADGATCTTSGTWGQGWIVFADAGASVGEVDAGEALIRVFDDVPTGVSIVGNTHVDDYLSYRATGFIEPLNNGTITLTRGEKVKTIVINNMGRVRVD